MRQVFGDQQDATRFMPQAAAFMSFDKAWGAHTGKETDSEKESMAAIKIAEQEIGGATPENIQKVMEKLYRAKVASGGNVTARDMLAIRNLTGSAAWNTMDDNYRYGVLPALFQTQNTQAGVQAMQMFKKFAAGITLAKPSIAAGIDAGLIDPNKVDYDKTGRPMRVQPGGMLHASEFAQNPLKMYEDYIKPYMDKTFGDDAIKRAAFLGQLGGAQSPIRGLSEFDATWHKLDKDAMLPHQVKGDMKSFVDNSLFAQMDAFGVQWKNLMTALGAPAVKDATAALRSINEVVAGWSNWMSKHPVRAQIFTEVATGVSALAIAVGGLGVAAAAAKVALWGLGGTAGVAGAAAGATGLPLLAGSAGALGAAGFGAYFGGDYLKKGFDKGADWLTGTKGDEEKRNRGIEFYLKDLTGEIHKFLNPPGNIAPVPGQYGPQLPNQRQSMSMPPAPSSIVNLNASFNIDARRLAQIVTSQMVSSAVYPTSAGGADSRGTWMGPSYAPTEQG